MSHSGIFALPPRSVPTGAGGAPQGPTVTGPWRGITLAPSRERPPRNEPPRSPFALRLHGLSLSRRQAVPVALILALVASVGDAWTTAEAAFTLLYLAPIGVAVWFHGRRFGYVIVALCTAGSVATDLFASRRPIGPLFLVWNNGAELGLFIVFLRLLDALRARLEQEIHRRQDSLDQLRHAERLNTVGKLAAGVAHELGTPLNVITGRAELVMSGIMDGAGARESLEIILAQAARMTAIIRGILDFARRSGERTAPTGLGALCNETATLLRPLAARAGVRIEVLGEDVEASVERAGIQQVLTNLITNAIHASRRGGTIEITVSSASEVPARGHGREEGCFAVIAVRDEGTGISTAILPSIFDPFFTTKDVGEGTGLGLSISYGIVRDHGGRIHVKTATGEGTTFWVFLPRG